MGGGGGGGFENFPARDLKRAIKTPCRKPGSGSFFKSHEPRFPWGGGTRFGAEVAASNNRLLSRPSRH
jgi:hypothetical protein